MLLPLLQAEGKQKERDDAGKKDHPTTVQVEMDNTVLAEDRAIKPVPNNRAINSSVRKHSLSSSGLGSSSQIVPINEGATETLGS